MVIGYGWIRVGKRLMEINICGLQTETLLSTAISWYVATGHSFLFTGPHETIATWNRE
jgi:hypothetical protein